MTADELVDRIERAIREYAEPARAPQMQAYMKSTMPYAGTPVPIVRKLTHAEAHVADRATLTAAVEQLWDDATVREERYAATALLSLPPIRADITLLPLVERMIVEGAWWDHVDELSHRIGELLSAHRTQMTSVLRTWSTDENIWRRRSAIISQLDARAETDLDLLTAAIEASVPGGPLTGGPRHIEREFFLRKAIGWALRQYARTDAEWVRQFVATHAAVLSPLSQREAMKHLSRPTP